MLFIAGVIVMDSGAPDFDAPPAEVIKYYGDSGNRDQVALGWGLILLGVFGSCGSWARCDSSCAGSTPTAC